MYTDEDLYAAVKDGVLDEAAVERFRNFVSGRAHTRLVDEENFRLISGFNDIFVSIAAFILLASAGWVFGLQSPALGFCVVALLSWGLSVFFVKRRKLALPAVLLLASFVLSTVAFLVFAQVAAGIEKDTAIMVATAIGAVAAWAHWHQFYVPITVAAGVASLLAFLLALLMQIEGLREFTNYFLCSAGLATFLLAMRWDAQDVDRTTRKSDVAFWLHLLAAPLIVHPVFSALGLFDGNGGLFGIAAVIVLYLLLAVVSITVDRRALMVSSLIYVVYALGELFETYGSLSSSLAISGLFIGSMLLLLSAFWHRSREILLHVLPQVVGRYVPPTN